jgi:MarR family transcriptional regulator, 2-MHQ and catechol-resistance regulon repressor
MSTRLDRQAEELHQVVTELVKKYQFRDRNEICCHGVSVSQCYALEALDKGGTLTMGELAQRMHLTVSTMTRVIDQLVSKELVERKFDPNDRRICCVEITGSGQVLLGQVRDELLATEKEILRKIKPEDRETLIFALKELSKAVDQWRAKTSSKQ